MRKSAARPVASRVFLCRIETCRTGPIARSLRRLYAPGVQSHGAATALRVIPAFNMPRSAIVQDLIWIGIAIGLALLSLLYVSLADRA